MHFVNSVRKFKSTEDLCPTKLEFDSEPLLERTKRILTNWLVEQLGHLAGGLIRQAIAASTWIQAGCECASPIFDRFKI